MTRLTREERRTQTISKLRGAALQEVAQTGFNAATIDRITEKAGFSRGAFYSNFKSKEELVLELLEQDNGEEMDAWQQLIVESASLESMYASMAERFVAYISKADWSVFLLEVQLHAKRNPEFNARYREHIKKTDERVRRLIEMLFERTNRKPPTTPELLSLSLRNYATALSMEVSWDNNASEPGKMAELIVLFLRGMVALGSSL